MELAYLPCRFAFLLFFVEGSMSDFASMDIYYIPDKYSFVKVLVYSCEVGDVVSDLHGASGDSALKCK